MAQRIQWLTSLTALLDTAQVDTVPEHLQAHAVDGRIPSAVAFPETFEQTAALLQWAQSEKLTVVPCGAGTQMALGRPAQGVDIVLSTSRLQDISDYDAANFTLTAHAGVTCAAVTRLTDGHGQTLPLQYAFSPATLGGLIATNADNPKRLLYGGTRDLLLGIRVALTNGEIAHFGGKVVKNVAGYDMARLFLGSLGTLGILVEATFKLFALPERDESLYAVFPTWNQAAAASVQLLSAPLLPSQILLLNAATIQQIMSRGAVPDRASAPSSTHTEASPDQGKNIAGEELAAEIVADGALLLVNVEGMDEAVERQLRDLSHLCRGQAAAAVGVIAGERQVLLRRRLAALAQASRGGTSALLHPSSHAEEGLVGGRIIVRLGTLPARVPAVMEEVARALHPVTSQVLMVGDCGIGWVRLILDGEAHTSAGVDARLLQVLGDLPRLVAAEGGSTVIEVAPMTIKERLDVWGPLPSAFPLLKALKAKFDPGGILNPGRFIGGL